MSDAIKPRVRDFIQKNFLFDGNAAVLNDQSLLGTGIVDSTGILELISFLEETYQLKFQDEELVAENFDSLNKISDFLERKLKE